VWEEEEEEEAGDEQPLNIQSSDLTNHKWVKSRILKNHKHVRTLSAISGTDTAYRYRVLRFLVFPTGTKT
jgi:hypothetical protein